MMGKETLSSQALPSIILLTSINVYFILKYNLKKSEYQTLKSYLTFLLREYFGEKIGIYFAWLGKA